MPREASCATGINGDQDDNSCEASGAVYLFRFAVNGWFQEAYIKASDTEPDSIRGGGDAFGTAVALSTDGNTLVVGAPYEDGIADYINGDPTNNGGLDSGAAYLFRFEDNAWFQQAYIKPVNRTRIDSWFHGGVNFGRAVALDADGDTLAVATPNEDSLAKGINGDHTVVGSDYSDISAGAAWVFKFDRTSWQQKAYVKASNADAGDQFGRGLALSADGETLAVGAANENSCATGIDGDQGDNSCVVAGAAYVY